MGKKIEIAIAINRNIYIMCCMKIKTTKEVLQFLGWTQAKFAEVCSIRQPTVSYRVKNEKPVTGEQALRLEAKTDLTRFQLRPDIFGSGNQVEQ